MNLFLLKIFSSNWKNIHFLSNIVFFSVHGLGAPKSRVESWRRSCRNEEKGLSEEGIPTKEALERMLTEFFFSSFLPTVSGFCCTKSARPNLLSLYPYLGLVLVLSACVSVSPYPWENSPRGLAKYGHPSAGPPSGDVETSEKQGAAKLFFMLTYFVVSSYLQLWFLFIFACEPPPQSGKKKSSKRGWLQNTTPAPSESRKEMDDGNGERDGEKMAAGNGFKKNFLTRKIFLDFVIFFFWCSFLLLGRIFKMRHFLVCWPRPTQPHPKIGPLYRPSLLPPSQPVAKRKFYEFSTKK